MTKAHKTILLVKRHYYGK